MTEQDIKNMSIKDLKNMVFDTLTDNGLDEASAEEAVQFMTMAELENFLLDGFEIT